MREVLIKQFEEALAAIDEKAVESYGLLAPLLVDQVNRSIESSGRLAELVGSNPVELVRANHENHASFMCSVLMVKSAPTLVDTVIWVYSSYIARGFRPEYFPVELSAWKEAVLEHMGHDSGQSIARLYALMIESHQSFLLESEKPSAAIEHAEAPSQRYLGAILKPSSVEALGVARESIRSVHDVTNWWINIIRVAMYEVGRLWAEGEITVGQEHLATSITQRVMSAFYPMILEMPRHKGSIVFTASPGELHEIGPRMMADILEIHGWNVYYTGADTPISSVVDLVRQVSADFLCISTTLPFNLDNTSRLIEAVRASNLSKNLGILVGGQAYGSDPDVWRKIGADAYADSLEDALKFLQGERN